MKVESALSKKMLAIYIESLVEGIGNSQIAEIQKLPAANNRVW